MGTNTMHWSKHVKFRPSWLFPKRQLSNCNLAHVGTLNSARSACSTFQSAFIWAIALVVLWNSSWAGLGESCVACATTEKHWCPVSTFSYCRGKAFLGKPATITFGKHKDVTHRSDLVCRHIETVDFIAILWRRPWEELVPWEPTPWHWSKHVTFRPSWLFQKGCPSLHGWQTAMLAHVGTLNSARSACSTFHTTFIRAKASVVLSSFFVWK